MQLYSAVVPATFLERPNRFVARVRLGEGEEIVHVKNTGRCRELLRPGARVYLAEGSGEKRRTRYDLVAVEKQRPDQLPLLVNMDSQAPNQVAHEWLLQGGPLGEGRLLIPSVLSELGGVIIRPESTFGSSRFDFYFEAGLRRAYMEVKGCTLENEGHACFPDAPTERGRKHILELIQARQAGYEAYILFVIQMEGMECFSPNDATDPAFGAALREAAAAGVEVLALECTVSPDSLAITKAVDVSLSI